MREQFKDIHPVMQTLLVREGELLSWYMYVAVEYGLIL